MLTPGKAIGIESSVIRKGLSTAGLSGDRKFRRVDIKLRAQPLGREHD
jgi:hypothetical protein